MFFVRSEGARGGIKVWRVWQCQCARPPNNRACRWSCRASALHLPCPWGGWSIRVRDTRDERWDACRDKYAHIGWGMLDLVSICRLTTHWQTGTSEPPRSEPKSIKMPLLPAFRVHQWRQTRLRFEIDSENGSCQIGTNLANHFVAVSIPGSSTLYHYTTPGERQLCWNLIPPSSLILLLQRYQQPNALTLSFCCTMSVCQSGAIIIISYG